MGDTPLEKILESSMSSESSSCKHMSEMIRPRLSGESNSPRMAPRDRGCGFPISRSAWSSSSASLVARRLWISSLFVRRRLLNMISRLSSGTEPKVLLGRCSTASMNSSSATIFNICIQLTCSRAASSQTSSLFGQCSQPALMSVLTATIQTGGSHPLWGVLRVRFGEGIEEHSGPLDITDLSLGLDSHAVQGCEVSLGSTEVAVPEVVPDTWSSLSDRILSRACPISTKLVKVPEFPGVSNPSMACDRRSYMGARR